MSTNMEATPTHFELLGLPVRYALDPDELERQYRERSRHWHPDRFSRAPASERAAVLKRATDLNQAYRILKSDTRRAEYLLKLRGIDVASEEPGKQPPMDPAFLAEVMELREELVEARMSDDGRRLDALRRAIDERMDGLRIAISAGFSRLEGAATDERQTLAAIVSALLAGRYFQRFLDEISAHEDAAAEAGAGLSAAPGSASI